MQPVQVIRYAPVSYTHLDVYKRQGCSSGSPMTCRYRYCPYGRSFAASVRKSSGDKNAAGRFVPGQKLHERLQQVVISRYIRENIGKTAFFILISSIPAFAPKGKMEKPRPLCYHGCRNGGDADVDACTGAGGVPAAGQMCIRDRLQPSRNSSRARSAFVMCAPPAVHTAFQD